MSDPIQRLTDLLKFDPAKKTVGTNVFADALAEVHKKRDEANKTRAIELLEKAIDLRTKFAEVTKQFQGQEKKFNKELGKLLNSIEAMAKGNPPPSEEKEEGND